MLGGKPLLVQTVLPFQRHPAIRDIALAVPSDDLETVRQICSEYALDKVEAIVPGGETRQDSVAAGLRALPPGSEIVFTHDAVRPFVSRSDVDRLLKALDRFEAAVLASPVPDTLCRGDNGIVLERVDREGVFRLLTPQGFRRNVLEQAHDQAMASGNIYTDEVTMVRALGIDVGLVTCSSPNQKITTPADWEQALWMWDAWVRQSQND